MRPRTPALERSVTALLDHPAADRRNLAKTAANLRVAVAGGSSLPVEFLAEFEKRFDAPILEGFGVSATSGVATFNHRDRPRKQSSVGLPLWDAQARSGA
ncbi:AMP-binding protein [Streptomyces sp. NPDC007095]|jgi:long-chain acyl-CoA synthetase|uniref:AMP-binding protein n=1 Tax=Streptomyces sp. NPDC007095 TaxID=3154482 RepID=UPI000C70EAEA